VTSAPSRYHGVSKSNRSELENVKYGLYDRGSRRALVPAQSFGKSLKFNKRNLTIK
jgi:hypothetical protein